MTRKMVKTLKICSYDGMKILQRKRRIQLVHKLRLLKRYTVERFNKELEIKFVVEERGWGWRHPFENDVIR